jgi:hypothetical protein
MMGERGIALAHTTILPQGAERNGTPRVITLDR